MVHESVNQLKPPLSHWVGRAMLAGTAILTEHIVQITKEWRSC
jgi:hypothetical protein